MSGTIRPVVFSETSPNQRWLLEIGGPMPNREDSAYYATHTRLIAVGGAQPPSSLAEGASWGAPFGYDGEPLTVRWDLPDNVCGAFIEDRCYYLLRWGASRRRRREAFRLGEDNAFSEGEIAWFCAKSHHEVDSQTG